MECTIVSDVLTELIELCKINEIKEGMLKSIDVEGIKIMVTKLGKEFIASSRMCTHSTFDLSKGHYADGYVTCMLHTSVFDLSTGEPMNLPAKKSLDLYKTVVKDDKLYLELD